MNYSLGMTLFAASAVLASPSIAFEFTGGEVSLDYSAYIDDIAGEDLNKTSLEGAVEFGFNRNFAMQVDLGFQNFGFIDESGYNPAVHGIYHLTDDTSFGLFLGHDDISSIDADYFGLQAGYESAGFEVEAYWSTGDVSEASLGSADVNIFGLAGAVDIAPNFQLTGGINRADFDGGISASQFEVGVRYAASDNFILRASIGSAKEDAFGTSVSENFFTIGGEITFGAERGATFGQRGLLRLFPGL